ncbi:adenosine deaminase [Lasallia pustulata]|uniref:Adenine deaminase n=1 Tax=Lasallia pustulata TaxID=136370 RepID=A0A1W5DEK3_9LECA|nr:adenosine deaminase [Lasallia pustulata]
MCRSPLHPLLAALPKCEHHLHIEGTLSPTLLFALSAKNSISLPSTPDYASPSTLLTAYDGFTSLDWFLPYYYTGMSVLIHASDFEQLAWEYFAKAHSDGVVHAEISFDPQAHTTRGIPYSTVVSGFNAACRRAEKELGISIVLILCLLRHLPVTDSERMFSEALSNDHFTDGTLGGLGLDSTEIDHPPELFKEVYASAKSAGIRRTAHAGEEGPVEYIASAIHNLDVSRIDHGIRLVDSDSLVAEVVEKKILVTLCPLSNVRLKCVRETREVPVRHFLDHGVMFSINSDDPAYFGGYLLDNYCAVQEAFGLSVEEWRRIAKASIEGSWCGEERKKEMLGRIDEVLGTEPTGTQQTVTVV